MSLKTRLEALATAVGTDIKAVRADIAARQAPIYARRIDRLTAANGVAGLDSSGMGVVTNYVAPSAVTLSASSFYASVKRTRYSVPGITGGAGGFRTGAQWHFSTTANKGGFLWVARVGIALGQPSSRAFFGLSSTNADLENADPTTKLNLVGFGFNTADSDFRFLHNGASGTATSVDLATGFPARTYATNFYEFRLFAPSGGHRIDWTAIRLNDKHTLQGSTTDTAKLPATDLLLASHLWMHSVAMASINLDVQQLYVESDN